METDKAQRQYHKMTETPIPGLVIRLGIPTTISMLVTSVYNMADTYFIGKEGTSASGAVGVVFGLMAIIQAFGFMFGQGSGSMSSRALGAREPQRASKYISTGFFSALAAGAIIAVLGLIFRDPLAILLGSTDTILPYAREYMFYILLAAPLMCASCVLNNALRFEGQALLAMIGLASGSILNIFGDWILMEKLHMGIRGAGISTAVSQVISFGILIFMFLRGKTSGKISPRLYSRNPRDLWDIVKTGFPSMVRQGLASISTMCLNDCARVYGDAAVSAMSIVNRICFFTFATALGIGQGFQPVSAFNYGAKKYSRVRQAFFFTFLLGEIFLGGAALIGIRYTRELVGFFRDDAEVIRIGAFALTVQFVGQIFQPLSVCTNMMFQSVGKSGLASLTATLRSGLVFLPILYLLSGIYGIVGVQVAQGITDIITMCISLPLCIGFLRQLSSMEMALKREEA